MGNYAKKGIDNREEETRRIKSEIKRRKAVLKEKETGKKIEDVDKERKKASVNSLIKRINLHIEVIKKFMSTIELELSLKDEPRLETYLVTAVNLVRDYHSIKEDFRNIFKEDLSQLQKLFPDKMMPVDNLQQYLSVLNLIIHEELQILCYLERFK